MRVVHSFFVDLFYHIFDRFASLIRVFFWIFQKVLFCAFYTIFHVAFCIDCEWDRKSKYDIIGMKGYQHPNGSRYLSYLDRRSEVIRK